MAEEVYGNEYIPHLDLSKVNRNAVAVASSSLAAVVAGAATSILMPLQRVLNGLGFPCGRWVSRTEDSAGCECR